jgi:CrcB protein
MVQLSIKFVALVALGGAIGSVARYLTGVGMLHVMGPGYPWGTLLVNIVGSFLMGLLVATLVLKTTNIEPIRLFLATGVLGGFTTFSAFSLEAVQLWERREPLAAVAYVTASVVLSILALAAGFAIVRALQS